MRKFNSAIPFLPLLLVLNTLAHGETGMKQLLLLDLDDLMSLKVRISTQTDQTLSRAPSVVTIVTAEDIKATGASNLTEILQSVPGIYVRHNLFGFRPQVTFRGAAGTHTLLMVNGTPIRDLMWSAGIFWKGLPTHMIERVEIISGPGSALFGSDASAGVINVITRTAGRIGQSEMGARVGNDDSQSVWMQHGGQWNGLDFGWTAQLSRTDGHDPFIAVDGQTSRDTTFGTQASYAPGHAGYGWDGRDFRFSLAKGNWRLHADYMGHDNLETGLTGAGVLDPRTRGSDQRFDLAWLYDNKDFSKDWGLNAEWRYYHLDYTSGDGFLERPPGYKDATGTYPNGVINQMRSAQRGFNLEVSGLYGGLESHAIRLGGGYKLDDLYLVEHFINQGNWPDGYSIASPLALVDISDTQYAFAPKKARRIQYFFLQDIWTLSDDLELTAGVRHDHYSDFGDALTPRLALVWQGKNRFTTKLMYGEAFRVPSYLELYALTSSNTPNPNLTPERSKTWELSFSKGVSRDLKLNLDLYQFEQSNLISADSTPAKQFQNIGNRISRGIELGAQWQASKTIRLAANLSHIEESAATFPRSIPKNKAYLRADWAFAPNWTWNAQANWIGRRPLPPGDARAPLNAYTLVDTTIRYFYRADWEFSATVRNLFDVDAREYSSSALTNNLPLPGRGFQAAAIYRF